VTPERLRELRNAVVEFHNAYVAYLEATSPEAPSHAPAEVQRLRGEVTALVPAAQEGLEEAGVNLVIYPPPAFGGPIRRGLANVVFAHESPNTEMGQTMIVRQTLDTARLAAAQLEKSERLLRRKRKSPLYWVDRSMRAVLGIPAYLLSLIFGVPVRRIDESPFGTALRIVGVVLEAFGVYFGGRAAKWW
jgi:hypothetical protein